LPHESAQAPTISPVLALLDVPVDDAQWQALDPIQRERRTLEAVKLLLLEESRLQAVAASSSLSAVRKGASVSSATRSITFATSLTFPGHR